MKTIWTTDEAEYHGEHVDFDPIWSWPKPVQQPHPPVLVGGGGEKVLDRVLAFGDEWIPNRVGSPEALKERIDELRDRAGRRVPVSFFGAKPESAAIERLAWAGVDRVIFYVPATPPPTRSRPCSTNTPPSLMGRLDELDLSLKLSKNEEAERLEAGWERLEVLRLALGGKLEGYNNGPPVCILFEGWDASGKGGAIKRLVRPFDLRHVRVAQFAAPTPDELRHHYLWRFWPVLPGKGGMAVLAALYGRVWWRSGVDALRPGGDGPTGDHGDGAQLADDLNGADQVYVHISEGSSCALR